MKDIVIKGSYIKWAVFVLPYVILLGIIVLQFFYPHCTACDGCKTTATANGAVTVSGVSDTDAKDEEAATAAVEDVKEEAPVETPEPEPTQAPVVNTTPAAPAATSADTSCKAATGTDFDITIDKITTFKKSDTYAKVTKVKYTIQNPKRDFVPTIKFQIVTDDSTRDILLPELKKGCQTTVESILPNSGIGYTNIDEQKTMSVTLYDGTNVLESASAKFTTTG